MSKKIFSSVVKFIAALLFLFCVIYLLVEHFSDNNVTYHVNNLIEEEEDEQIDYAALTNIITTEAIKANVTIYCKSYKKVFFIETYSATAQGSGVIIGENSNGYYFALTNCHVAVKINGYTYQDITVKDYKGNEYTATKYHESAEYDLAVIYFKKKIVLNSVKIEKDNPNVGDDIVSLGQPGGQANAITWGKVLNYQKNTLIDTATYKSNITFNVIVHDAPIAGGSSGGAVLSKNLKLAGINYAGGDSVGAAIPAKKISEYLNKYFYV